MSLTEAYEAAKGRSRKKKPFVIAGETYELPRLSLGRRAEFEIWMHKNKDERFSLSRVRNRAALCQADIVSSTIDEWKADGRDMDFASVRKTEATKEKRRDIVVMVNAGKEAGEIAKALGRKKEDVDAIVDEEKKYAEMEGNLMKATIKKLGSYLDEMFSPLDTEAEVKAITLAMQQEYGKEATDEVVMTILEDADDNAIDHMCLWALGLENAKEEAAKPMDADSIEELLTKTFGDPKNSETGRAGKSTTSKRSRSSRSPTEDLLIGSGDSQKTSSATGSMELTPGSGSTGS